MPDDFEKLFSQLPSPDLPEGLFGVVLAKIAARKKARIKFHLAIFALTSVISLAALVPALTSLSRGFSNSGFMEFLSLTFSDFRIVSAYWQNYVLSLLEALPVLETAIFLAILLSLIESLRLTIRDLKIFHKLKLI